MKRGDCNRLCLKESRRPGYHLKYREGYRKLCQTCGYYIDEKDAELRCYCCGTLYRGKPHGSDRRVIIIQKMMTKNRFKRY